MFNRSWTCSSQAARGIHRLLGTTCAVGLVVVGTAARAQNQFGGQQRADAAQQLITLAVERAIASLPPTAGQSVTYEFDPASDAMRRSTRLGPTVLRSAQTLGRGTLSVRVATSYFELGETFGPANYFLAFDEPRPGETVPLQGVAKIGLSTSAKVGLINLSAGYGITNRIDVTGSLPLTIVDAQASQIFSTVSSTLNVPPGKALVSGPRLINGDLAEAIRTLDGGLRSGDLALRRERLTALGFDFNDGTHAGVGRISLGVKGLLWTTPALQLAAVTEVFLPSPSSNEFAGSDTFSILPRVVVTGAVTDWLRLHSDVGYDYDVDEAALRRFTWSAGGSISFERFSADLGFGGSEYDQSILWTPTTVHGVRTAGFPPSTGHALEDTGVGTSIIDILLGAKVRVSDNLVIAGGVTVPIVNTDFQPNVLGTVAVERYF
jgi:hypothetical protein